MRRQLEPGPDHPITITRKDTPVRILLAGDLVLATPHHFELRENAVWTYETPFPAVAEIKDALAVYAERVGGVLVG